MIAKATGRGAWITTYPTCTKFYPQQPLPEDVHIEDIAHSLAMQSRFLGHVSRFYSVGEHSCHVADWVWSVTEDKLAAACALLHDGEETYVGDMPRPVKHFGPLAAYRSLCDRCTVAIMKRFELSEGFDKYQGLIKTADDQLLHTEARRLAHGADWVDDDKVLPSVQIDQFSEQEVIDLLGAALQGEKRMVTAHVANVRLCEAIEAARLKLMRGGVHARWRREFMDRFERWVL